MDNYTRTLRTYQLREKAKRVLRENSTATFAVNGHLLLSLLADSAVCDIGRCSCGHAARSHCEKGCYECSCNASFGDYRGGGARTSTNTTP